MSTHNFEGESPVSESIHASLLGNHALSRSACDSSPGSHPIGAATTQNPNSSTTALVFSNSNDVFYVLRSIRSLYGSGGSESSDLGLSPRSIVAHQSGNSKPDGDEDFESLREMQKEFRLCAVLVEDKVADEDDLTLAELKKSLKKRKRELENLKSKCSVVTDGNVQDPPNVAVNRAQRTRIKPRKLEDYLLT